MSETNHAGLMDNVYRSQRHFYDFTRKYYLLGRDRLIENLAPEDGAKVLEVGCGTGRNLILAAKKYPNAHYYGFDISEEMLITARKNVEKAGLSDKIFLAKGNASDFSFNPPFAINAFDRIFYSYTLSMIPPWQAAIEQGILSLKRDGSLHIVDFGQQEKLPGFFRKLLKKWLEIFHVEPRNTLFSFSENVAAKNDLSYSYSRLYRGYAWEISMEKGKNKI